MDGIVDSLEKAYKEFVTAAAIVLETKEANGGKKPEDGVDPSLESLREHLVSHDGLLMQSGPIKVDDEKTKTDMSASES
ncbi:hypothetical protein HAX54_019235 [Datura stramonium]|uniref:Uncharacterized protein n=1 Tax=Datura stramonium TaxID=4076 RepID=A0ABS8UQT7_DATST|nr:hypothetical protein [Datura stramonium]